MSKFLMGSRYFFSCYEDFNSKDIDEIEIVETNDFKNMRQLTGQNKCLFQLKKQNSKDKYIEYALQSNLGMVVGKFLIPEFCKEIGLTIEDLPKFKPLIEKLDDKHKYEEIIFNSYIDNGSFSLTNNQRERAYSSYKKSRGESE
jgi:hypothetical protein